MKRLLPFLPLLAFFTMCSGGGGTTTRTPALPGASGEVCISGEGQYTINGETTEFKADPFFENFKGNIGGQIRAVTSAVYSIEDSEPLTIVIYGMGSSIQSGAAGYKLTPTVLAREGAITDIVTFGSSSKPNVFYGTKKGLGVAELNDEGVFVEKAYKALPPGVLSVAVKKGSDRTTFFFVTGDGYVLSADEGTITSGSGCFSILTSKDVLKDGDTSYMPVKVAVAGDKAFVLAQRTLEGGLTPTFDQVFNPILETLITGEPSSIVRMVDIPSHGIDLVAFAASEGLIGFDAFIPSDVASDGTNFYVSGLAYEKEAVDLFVMTECDKPSMDDELRCMRDETKSYDLIKLKTDLGVDALTAGFFIYRDVGTVPDAAAYFARSAITTYMKDENAPPLVFHIAVKNDEATFRAPNYLAMMVKDVDAVSGKETWKTSVAYDKRDGLYMGIPANLSVISSAGESFMASTFVALKNEDGGGASMIEVVRPDGSLFLDTGSMKTRMEDGVGSYLAAIDTTNEHGGILYLENVMERNRIDLTIEDSASYVGRSAYNGTHLAFVWTKPGQVWRLDWQKGTEATTRGELTLSDVNHFKDFPAVSASDTKAWGNGRDIADLAFSGNKLFALLYGFTGGRHYYQVVVYNAPVTDSVYHPGINGFTRTISFAGDEIDRRARIQKITTDGAGSYTVHFSCAGGLNRFDIRPSSPPPAAASITTLFSTMNVMDLDMNDAGDKFAFIKNKTIHVRSLASPGTELYSASSVPAADATVARLSNASIVMTDKRIFLSTPVGASAPFWILDISTPPEQKVLSKCDTCDFNGLATFGAFANQLLVSSPTGGVEIYDISGL